MKKVFCMLMATILLISSMSVSAFALTSAESNNQLNEAFNAMFDSVAGDVNKDGKFDALDARSALLASVGVDEDINDDIADMDGDGVITSLDVRALLRISAKLDSYDVFYTTEEKFNLFNAFANNIKATNLKFQYTGMDKNVDISHNNPELVKEFNDEMNGIPGMKEEDKIDLNAELTKDKGKTTYKCSTRAYSATDLNFPVKEKDFVSKLTINDISSITYKPDQSYTFAPKRTSGNRVQELTENNISMTGLDVITVKFAKESMTKLPDDLTTLRHGRIFNELPTNADLVKNYEDMNKEFAGLADTIGTMNASLKNINYHDSSVSIYFNRATGKICVIEYDLYYDFTINLAMDLNVTLLVPPVFIDIEGNVDFTDKENSKYVYCFPDNCTA